MKLTLLFLKKTENKKDKLFYAYDEKTKDIYTTDLQGIKVRMCDMIGPFMKTMSLVVVAAILLVLSLITQIHVLLYIGILIIGWSMALYFYAIIEKIQEYIVEKKQFELYPEVTFTVQSMEQNFQFFNDKMKRTVHKSKKMIIVSLIICVICLIGVVYYQLFNFQPALIVIFTIAASYSSVFLMMILQAYTFPKRRKEILYQLKIEKKWRELRKSVN